MAHRKSTPALLAALILLLSQGGVSCRDAPDRTRSSLASNRNILRLDVSIPLAPLNPAKTQWSFTNLATPLLYSHLCMPDGNGDLQPDLAVAWSHSPDHRTWTIRLRQDARFHDGTPVTAADVNASLETKLRIFLPSLSAIVAEIKQKSVTEIEISLTRGVPDLMQRIWDHEIFPATRASLIDSSHPVGSGPFKFLSRDGERSLILEANTDYYGGRPALDGVVFTYIRNKEEIWTRMLAGATDAAQAIAPGNYEIMQQYGRRFYFDHYTMPYYAILLFNSAVPPFDDVRVRRALAMAVDRDLIIQRILRGYGRPAVGPMGVDSPFHDPNVSVPSYDPSQALELLAQSGWKRSEDGYLQKDLQSFAFEMLVPAGRPTEQRVARHIQLALNDAGIRVRLRHLPYNDLIERYLHRDAYEAVLTEVKGVYRDLGLLEDLWASDADRSPMVGGGFSDRDVVGMIHTALAEKRPHARNRLLRTVDARITALHPGIFLYHKTSVDVLSRRFKLSHPFSLDYPGLFRLKWISVDSSKALPYTP
jgi:peptide/nickel transport system substrate-binding protein